ncbi:site-specific integrase [uncultured Methylophaga sp.]|uniref:tyrosine-type recombinase/integrase n=1 Tax=uncultured Methylophaga sp. TaxID=285271 RepID=UPI00260A2938|nr:site-specific integrase [uncultured Methylophaga sp.]
MFETKLYIEPSGQRNMVLLDQETGLPDFWSTLYITNSLRARQLRLGSIEKHLQSIQLLHIWCQLRNIKIIQRISSGESFSINEIDFLNTILKLRADELEKIFTYEKSKLNKEITKVEHPRSLWRILEAAPRQISPTVFNDRIHYIAKYVEWLANILSDKHGNGITREQIRSVGFNFKTHLNSLKIPAPKENFAESKSLKNSEIKRILEIVDPNSSENPWDSEATKVRNLAIILILLDTGIRSGELLNLKITDVLQGKTKHHGLQIVQRSGSLDDPRKRQRLPKSVQREVPLSDTAFRALNVYVTKVRAITPNADQTQYIFVSHSNSTLGQPIKSINSITDSIREITSIDLTPHVLRHTATWKYCVRMKKLGKEWGDFVELLLLKFGWTSEKSRSVRLYARQFVKEELFERQLEYQNEIEKEIRDALEAMDKVTTKSHD